MKKLRYLILLLMSVSWFTTYGQVAGSSIYVPIDAGIFGPCGKTFTDVQNNDASNGFSNFIGQPSPEVYYTFTLTGTVQVDISLCGSGFDTYLHILDGNGNEITANDDNGPLCTGLESSISMMLTAGTYYVACEGYSSHTGNISLSLSAPQNGSSSPAGSGFSNPIELGTIASGGSVSDTKSNDPSNCFGNHYGQSSDDITYRFTIGGSSQVNISLCGSSIDTYVHLLDVNGTPIATNDDNGPLCAGLQSSIQYSLPAGTYYIVSEGWSTSYGSITTQISVTGSGTPYTPPESNSAQLNWIYNRSYDENGNILSESKVFYDFNGAEIQAQVKNETANQVIASEKLYDAYHRPSGGTLAAPVNNSAFFYKDKFVTDGAGNKYSFLKFDLNKTDNADPVGQTTQGTLGWYYSNNNTLEPYVAATAYPYDLLSHYHDGTGNIKRSSGVGDILRMGSGHESTSNNAPVMNELNNYFTIRNKFFPSTTSGASPLNVSSSVFQNVTLDANGKASMVVTDISGRRLMSCQPDQSGWLNVTNTINLVSAPGDFQINVAIGASIDGIAVTSFKLNSVNNVYVFRNGVFIYYGNGNDFVFDPNIDPPGGASYKITSYQPFFYSLNNGIANAASRIADSPTRSSQYFYLFQSQPITISGDYTLYDMATESNITGTFNNGSTLPSGYYKLVANPGYSTVTMNYTNSFSNISYTFYDQLGQMIGSIAPNGVQTLISNINAYNTIAQIPYATINEYDIQGHMISSTTTDGGRTEFIYRQDGKVRFSQNVLQRNANGQYPYAEKFSYTNYDDVGRAVESGEYVLPIGSTAIFQSTRSNSSLLENTDPINDGLTGGVKQDWIKTHYDVSDNGHGLNNYIQDDGFLKGAISWTENTNSRTWYNYDDRGRIMWLIKQVNGLGPKTIDYTFNDQGTVMSADYQRNDPAERFVHHYEYDADGKIINVMTSRDGINKLQQAHYYYYLHGPLKRVELGVQLQGIDYVYTADGALKSINHAGADPSRDPGHDGQNTFLADGFGEQVEYFTGDYVRAGTGISSVNYGQNYFNGNIKALGWQSQKPQSVISALGVAIQNPTMYNYTYDNRYQMTGATWGVPDYNNFNFTPQSKFAESGITYDPNGNIQSLQRTNSSGVMSDDFSNYQYQAGTNKLTSVGNSGNSQIYATYTYDELGQLKSQTQAGITFYVKYNVLGLVTGIYSDAAMTQLKVGYSYDENGKRISRTDNIGTTYYMYDLSGSPIAIYQGNNLAEVSLYGADKLGTYTISDGTYKYELRDNVGSVRVVINRDRNNQGQLDIMTYNDYYPYGSVAQSGGINYRYDYQGAFAEKDPVTNFNNFDLRMYDGKIGRWLSVDPVGQFSSPYVGMGNDPVNGADPSGGFWQEFKNWLKGDGWISNEGVNFMKSHPGAKLLDWTGDRKTGYATVEYAESYVEPKSDPKKVLHGVSIVQKKFKAVQDYTFKGVDITFDYTTEISVGLRASLLAKGIEGFDINMGSVKLAAFSWAKGEWEHASLKNFEWSLGFSIDHEGVGFGGEIAIQAVDGHAESLKISGNIDYLAMSLKANYDLIQRKFGAELGAELKIGAGVVLSHAIKLVVEQHTGFHH